MTCTDVSCKDEQHVHDRDEHVLDILLAAIETSYEYIPLSNTKKSGKNVKEPLPGWT